ncbi:MAG: diguanylate cyclase [Planctomycetota bacterium]|nr:MAG: diguanylate cyclase [Planctomycetota bacterium]
MERIDDQPTVLLIDDSPEILRLLEVRLRNEDFALVTAQAAVDGLRIARERRPALILLDLDMPVMDGFEALRHLKEDPRTVSIPVIVISGSDDTDDKVAGFDLGAIDYVCKPFNMPELRARVRSALKIHELMRMLEQRAQIDGLTGLWNRAYFDERLVEEIAHHQRHGRPFSLVLADLDHFKSLNDTHGHPAGDAVLQGFARLLESSVRAQDVACRYGGEEFVILLRDTKAEQARALVERVRAGLEALRWPRHPERRVTGSFGICDAPAGDAGSPAAWLQSADDALYQAKRAGRNRVVIFDPAATNDAADTQPAPVRKAG